MTNGTLQRSAEINKKASDYVTFLSMEMKSVGDPDSLTCSFTISKKLSTKLRLI